MADLQETQTWTPGIYQIETNDPVVGGPPDLAQGEGISNVQAQQLASRTAWLKQQIADLAQDVAGIDFGPDIQAAINNLVNGAPAALDTLNELAVAVQSNDSELAAFVSQMATIQASIDNVDFAPQIQLAINSLIAGAPSALNTLNELAVELQSNDNAIAALISQVAALQNSVNNINVTPQINAAINNLIAGAPSALNTLNELAAALQSNDSEIATLISQMSQISGKVLGVGQTWQTPARNIGTTYQNTTGRPIMISIGFRWNGGYAQVSANGSIWKTIGRGSEHTGDTNNADFIVPHGYFYKVSGGTKHYWSELR